MFPNIATSGDGGHDEPRPGEEERAEGPGVGVVQVDLGCEDAVPGVRHVADVLAHALVALPLRLLVLGVVALLTVVNQSATRGNPDS